MGWDGMGPGANPGQGWMGWALDGPWMGWDGMGWDGMGWNGMGYSTGQGWAMERTLVCGPLFSSSAHSWRRCSTRASSARASPPRWKQAGAPARPRS
eukprot:6317516-Pyramimonas_sp.AAC.1